jgi:hypothetical protein
MELIYNNNLNQNKNFQNTINFQQNKKLKLNYSVGFEKICNKCGKNLINDFIYKCEECYEFKYCEKCYLIDNKNHRHKFIKIKDDIKFLIV